MEQRQRYILARDQLLHDPHICPENRAIFKKFFEYEEYKLKRLNRTPDYDHRSATTLLNYTSRLRVVNRWFENKPWPGLTESDIRSVYDRIENHDIRTIRTNKPIMDSDTYYNRIWRSKPFELAGISDAARAVLANHYPRQRTGVSFIREAALRRLVDYSTSTAMKTLLWLCFDIGENASALLKLRVQDCTRRVPAETGDPEYAINLHAGILKRSRTARTEVTNYAETVAYLDELCAHKAPHEPLFAFGSRQALKAVQQAAQRAGVACEPSGAPVTLKVLRSSMACDLLSKEWSRDEVNARLGHVPSSPVIDRYITYLAMDRTRPKRRLQTGQIQSLTAEVSHSREQEELWKSRFMSLAEEVAQLKASVRRHVPE